MKMPQMPRMTIRSPPPAPVERARRNRSPPRVFLRVFPTCSVLRVTPLVTVAESAAGQEQNYDDDEQNRDHGSPPRSGWVGSRVVYFCFLGLPVRASATLSTASLTEPLAWSTRPSSFRRWFPVSAPAASFTRPLALSMFLSGMNPPSWSPVRSAQSPDRGSQIVGPLRRPAHPFKNRCRLRANPYRGKSLIACSPTPGTRILPRMGRS